MSRAHDADMLALLTKLAAGRPAGSWLTGRGPRMRSTETISGAIERVEDGVAVLSTPGGERRVSIDEIETVRMKVQSTGPE